MDEADALYTLAAIVDPALGRVRERAQRGRTLEAWGLKPHRADPGTIMAHDDGDDYEQKIPEGLRGTVAFPIMNATDALASIDILITAAAIKRPFNHHAPAVLSMCRTSIECSAQAIWVMSPLEQDKRRARAAGLAKIGIEHAKEFHSDSLKAHDNGLQRLPDETYAQSRHRLKFHSEELEILEQLSQENGRRYSILVRKSANWIKENPPKHTNETRMVHFPTMATMEYRVCSSFTHGHSWPVDLVGRPSEMFSMMADALATALIYTECAVSLFEAQSTDPTSGRTNYYPERLQPTIDEWRDLYQKATNSD